MHILFIYKKTILERTGGDWNGIRLFLDDFYRFISQVIRRKQFFLYIFFSHRLNINVLRITCKYSKR